MRRIGMPITECQLQPRGSDREGRTVAISGGADGHYRVEPQEGLKLRGGAEYDLVWPKGYIEPVTVWGEDVHEAGTPKPYLLERGKPDDPHPECEHPWISTNGNTGGPAIAKCHSCGGQTTGPSAQGAVEAFGVEIADYDVMPQSGAPRIRIMNGPFEFHRKRNKASR